MGRWLPVLFPRPLVVMMRDVMATIRWNVTKVIMYHCDACGWNGENPVLSEL
jgi:hypothetical protein